MISQIARRGVSKALTRPANVQMMVPRVNKVQFMDIQTRLFSSQKLPKSEEDDFAEPDHNAAALAEKLA